MPIVDAATKLQRLVTLQNLFWGEPTRGYTTSELATRLSVCVRTVRNYLNELGASGHLPIRREGWKWVLVEGASFDLFPLKFSIQEAVGLYLAARLLARGSDEHNPAVYSALAKLANIMHPRLRPSLSNMVDSLVKRTSRRDKGFEQIFNVMAVGWVTQTALRITYHSMSKNERTRRLFCPYLMEASAVGNSLYASGYSDPPGELRTFKLERVEEVELTCQHFEVPPEFDGQALLDRAWGIMYGAGEPVTVRLHFYPEVTRRVKESLWHASQVVEDVPGGGCILTLKVGDTLEITPWIRSWGSSCEVLAPIALRKAMEDEVARLALRYASFVSVQERTKLTASASE